MWLARLALGNWDVMFQEIAAHEQCCGAVAKRCLQRGDPEATNFNSLLTDAYGSSRGCHASGWRRRMFIYLYVQHGIAR
jgi:hypothetical protein